MTNAIIPAEAHEVQTQNFVQAGLVERFIRFAGVSPKSAQTYKTCVNQLNKYFATNNIQLPTREDLEVWRDGLIDAGKSPATVQLYLTSAKIFFRWLAQEGIYKNIADNLKARVRISHEHKKDALTTDQAATLIKTVSGDSLKNLRDRAIVSLMVCSALRCVEVTRLDVADMLNQFGRTYLLIQGKGYSSKSAKVLLPRQCENLIRDYLTARGNVEAGQPLFTSTANRNRGSRLSPQTVSKLVKAHLRAAGFDSPRLTAHSLRHTALTQMIFQGVDLVAVQMVARHTSVAITQRYLHTVERMRNTAEQQVADAFFNSISA
ncbi:MAG: tyrosine-type recombinase/integrase [Selenomonadaceae bacterium]|nr:tyrosine-type recombinase/integrase [Selenomonadaceae bacterium]